MINLFKRLQDLIKRFINSWAMVYLIMVVYTFIFLIAMTGGL